MHADADGQRVSTRLGSNLDQAETYQQLPNGTRNFSMHSSNQGENQRWLQARRMPVFGYLLPVRVIVALVLIPLLSSRLLTQNPKPTEYDVKAAYLFNFGKFVTWPQKNYGPGDSFLVCVIGKDPFGPILDKTTAGETINGKKVIDKRISRPQDAVGCSVLFISSSEEPRLGRILAIVEGLPVVTVSDMSDFVERGGMIQFVVDSGRVRFKVNLGPAQQDGLALSSELLKVAIQVTPGSDRGNR